MDSDSVDSLREWVKSLPASQMVYPTALTDRIKYAFWRIYTPYHSWVRDTATKARIVRHEGRQDFLFGVIAPHLTVQEFVMSLIEKGFGNHFVAWKDDGELVSLRYVKDFAFQYHLRIFVDREVRGHYEYTPEYRPVAHIREVGMLERKEDFLIFLQDQIV